MSKIGKRPIDIPQGVKINIEGSMVKVEGPKGKLEWKLPEGIECKVKDNKISVCRVNDTKKLKSLHGLSRAIINNMVIGVWQGFQKELDIVGVGYKASLKGKILNLQLGFSHPVEFPIPEGIEIEVPTSTRIIVKGIDKQLVGQVAASIRRIYPPEPYKGKGIRYAQEEVRKKLGKAMGK